MKTLHVTQLFAQANTHRSPSSRERDRARTSSLVEAFINQGGQVQHCTSYEEKPLPARRSQVDPETIPKRRSRCRAEIELEQRAVSIISSIPSSGMQRIREALRDAGITMPTKRVEMLAARHGFTIYGA